MNECGRAIVNESLSIFVACVKLTSSYDTITRNICYQMKRPLSPDHIDCCVETDWDRAYSQRLCKFLVMRSEHSRDVIRSAVKASNDNLLHVRLVTSCSLTLDFFMHSPNQILAWSAIMTPIIGNIRVVAGITRASRTNCGLRIETALFLDILGDAFVSMAWSCQR